MNCLPDANIKRVLDAIGEGRVEHANEGWPEDAAGKNHYWLGAPGDSSVGIWPQTYTPSFETLEDLDAYCAEHYAEIVAQWGDVAEGA